MVRTFLGAVILTAGLASPALACPDLNQGPTQGFYTISANFNPDPIVLSILAGGQTDLATCSVVPGAGFLADAPDFSFEYTAGQFNLTILTRSSIDTILLVNAPDGSWRFDDDSGSSLGSGGSDAAITFQHAASGRYDVWVGVLGGANPAQVQVEISELY